MASSSARGSFLSSASSQSRPGLELPAVTAATSPLLSSIRAPSPPVLSDSADFHVDDVRSQSPLVSPAASRAPSPVPASDSPESDPAHFLWGGGRPPPPSLSMRLRELESDVEAEREKAAACDEQVQALQGQLQHAASLAASLRLRANAAESNFAAACMPPPVHVTEGSFLHPLIMEALASSGFSATQLSARELHTVKRLRGSSLEGQLCIVSATPAVDATPALEEHARDLAARSLREKFTFHSSAGYLSALQLALRHNLRTFRRPPAPVPAQVDSQSATVGQEGQAGSATDATGSGTRVNLETVAGEHRTLFHGSELLCISPSIFQLMLGRISITQFSGICMYCALA